MNKVIHSAGVMLDQAKGDADKARVAHESAQAATTRARLKFEQAQGTLSSARDDLLDAASRSRPDRANTRLKALAVEVRRPRLRFAKRVMPSIGPGRTLRLPMLC